MVYAIFVCSLFCLLSDYFTVRLSFSSVVFYRYQCSVFIAVAVAYCVDSRQVAVQWVSYFCDNLQVALRLNTSAGSGGRKLRSGDAVVYVVCDDGSSLPATQRAYHPDLEVAKRSELTVDARYYLEQQVHPVVSRLCDPIEGTDAARIAECLGLDASHFRQALRRDEDEDAAVLGTTEESEAEKFRDCEEMKFPCQGCGNEIKVSIVQDFCGSTLASCPGCKLSPLDNMPYVRNQLTQAIRRHVHSYYEGWHVCEDPACAMRTRQTPLVMNRGQPVCPACRRSVLHPEFSERSVYRQLGFYQHSFSIDKVAESQLSKLKSDVDKVVSNSAYSEVNLTKLFEGLFPQKIYQEV